VEKPEGKSPFEDNGKDEKTMLKCIVKKWDRDMDWIRLAQNRECCNEIPASIKCGEFLD
jgi:hypothetical protein